MILQLADFSGRDNFGRFLNGRGLNGTGAEVGTHRGEFAFSLLCQWFGKLYCVDPWGVPVGYEGQAKALAGSTGDRTADFEEAKRVLSHFGPGRVNLVRQTSREATYSPKSWVTDESLDFVYVDGDHRFEMVLQDLSLWWPKLRKGGILAGHDFICPGEPDGGWGKDVQAAVDEFLCDCHPSGVEGMVYIVPEPICVPWSFYVEKS